MATYTGYSEKELEDKALIEKYCCIRDDYISTYIEHFSDPSKGGMAVFFNLVPSERCSDGKRRTTCVEYIDFLFESPTIEECVATANASPNRNFTVTLNFSNRACVEVWMALRNQTFNTGADAIPQ